MLVFFNEIERVFGFEKGVLHDPTPSWNFVGSPGIKSPDPNGRSRWEIGEIEAQIEEQFATAGFSTVEFLLKIFHHISYRFGA